MLQIHGLSKRFGDTVAVDDVSLAIHPGTMVGVIGRSGAGKSTLLRLFNRLIEPSAGRLVFEGRDVTGLRGRELLGWRARCAMIFQQFNLVPRLDVLTNVLVGRLNHRRTLPTLFKLFGPAERALAIAALERVDMVPQALQRADTLSGGQQQRVAIARALVQEPRLILADEPIASLDPRNAARVMETLRAINREAGITVVCNLHTLDTARQYCDRVVGMARGRVVFDGAPDGLDHDTVAAIYGVDGGDEELREAVTSIALPERKLAVGA